MSIEFCKKCTISNFRPSSCIEYKNDNLEKEYIKFIDGICSACIVNSNKKEIDWDKRKNQLIELLNNIKSSNTYDIVLPASGGKDSTFACYILNKLHKVNSLSVTWAPHIYSLPGFKNLQNMIHNIGIDNVLFTPNGKVHRLLTKLALKNLLHPFQPFILGQKNIALKMALKYNVNTMFYGENEAEYGNNTDDLKIPFRKLEYCVVDDNVEDFNEFIISGEKVKNLIANYGLTLKDLEPYLPLKKSQLNGKDIKIYYLSYFYKWDPQDVYYTVARNCGFMTNDHRTEGSYCKYSSFDDRIDGFHYYTTWIKFGLGRASYDTSQEIRNDKISLEEGKILVKKYDGEFPMRFFVEILNYLDMGVDEFFDCINQFRNPILWEKLDDNKWKLKCTCYNEEKIDDNYNKVKEYLKSNTKNDYLIKYNPL